MEYAGAARTKPLDLAFSTAGWDRMSIGYAEYEYAAKVRDGVIRDAAYLSVIYEMPADADWTDPKSWADANPNLGISVNAEELAAKVAEAQQSPSKENNIRRYRGNQWVEQEDRFLSMERWRECPAAARLSELAGATCYGGLDLA